MKSIKYYILSAVVVGTLLGCNKENPTVPDASFIVSPEEILLGEPVTIKFVDPSAEKLTVFSGVSGRKYSEYPSATGSSAGGKEFIIIYPDTGVYTISVLAINYGNWGSDMLMDVKEKTIKVLDGRNRIQSMKIYNRTSTIDHLRGTITMTIWTTEDKTAVIPEFANFSPGAKVYFNGEEIISKVSVIDLSQENKIITVVPPSGLTLEKEYRIIVEDYIPNSGVNLLSLNLQITPAYIPTIDHVESKIQYDVPYGWQVGRVRVSAIADLGASIKWGTTQITTPANVTVDFTKPLVVTSEDQTNSKEYSFEVNKAKPFQTFSFNSLIPIPVSIIAQPLTKLDTGLINIDVLAITDVTNLVATFTGNEASLTKVNGLTQKSGVTANDFSLPVLYQIFPNDKSDTLVYKVVVNKK